jgi:hypothetical protein
MKSFALFFLFFCLTVPCYAGGEVFTGSGPTTDLPSQRGYEAGSRTPRSDNSYSPSDANKTPLQAFGPHAPARPGTIDRTLAGLTLVMFTVATVSFLIWLVCLIDILRSEFAGNHKIVWFLAVFLLPVIGSMLYFFVGTDQKIRPEDDEIPAVRLN